MKKIKVVGVPEHFNYPWHSAIEKGLFEHISVEIIWQDVPEGSGAMNQMIRSGEADIALILTESALRDIAMGSAAKICSSYVDSPLIWGVHTPAHSQAQEINDLKGQKIAISRYGSGSHLMSYVMAKQNGWNMDKDLHFEVVNNLAGARESFSEQTTEGFLWEKFMTQPLVDSGEFRRIGEVPTPWPCFAVVIHPRLHDERQLLCAILEIIFAEAQLLKTNAETTARLIADRYKLQKDQVSKWLTLTQWSKSVHVDKGKMQKTLDLLEDLSLIDAHTSADDCILNISMD